MIKCWDLSYCCLEVRGSCPGCRGCPGWVLYGKCRSPFVRFKGVGGFGWLMFEEVFGAFMAMYDEMLGSLKMLLGSPG